VKVVALISAITEWAAVKDVLTPVNIQNTPYGESFLASVDSQEVTFFHAGWGKAASAGAMQFVIDHYAPDLTVNLGTCGGFEGVVELGEIILVERTFIYDIVELMGDFDSVLEYYASDLGLNWLPEPYPHPVRCGVLASADSDLLPEKIPQLKAQGAIVADWESASLAWVAQKNDARLLILRSVSDLVNEQGGEAYGNLQLFKERTKGIMRRLIEQLPDWIASVKVHIESNSGSRL
jgi:adenosylhomocysteine nucleosidase